MEAVKCPYCCRNNTIECKATCELILVCLHCANTFAAYVEVSIDVSTSKLCGINGIDHKLIAADGRAAREANNGIEHKLVVIDGRAAGEAKLPYSVCGECREIVFNIGR